MKLLLIGLNVDGTDVGEAYRAFKWTEALSERAETTLLCLQRPGRQPVAEQLPKTRVITFDEPEFLDRHERFRALAKPAWPIFSHQVKKWLRAARNAGCNFDIAHQLVPAAMRYSSPLRSTGIRYVIGPVGGSLPTPPAFRSEVDPDTWLSRMRALDSLRIRFDPFLRQSFANAEVVLGHADYVRDFLKPIPLRQYRSILPYAAEPLAIPFDHRPPPAGALRLLHVGRGIRTKGLRDVIRALALLPDLPSVTLTSAGDGPEIERCRQEAEGLGIASRITFLGKVPRSEVENLYQQHDVFAFPSFREPMGSVFFEAMRWGLPVIAADCGGAQAIVDDSCGIRVPVTTPKDFAVDIADAIRQLVGSPDAYARLRQGAFERIRSIGDWSVIADRMITLYNEILEISDQHSARIRAKGQRSTGQSRSAA